MTEDKGILIKNVYYMLSYAFQELKRNNFEDIQGEDFENIEDLFAEILVRGVSYQLKQGLHRTYIEKSETLPTLRGRIDMAKTVRNYSVGKRRLHCEYDECSANNLFNQIIKTTLLILLKSPDVKTLRKNQIRQVVRYLSDVEEIDIRQIHWSSLRFDRNTRVYRMLLFLCKFVIDKKLLTTETGSVRMATFSDDNMNRLFEKFVLEYYRRKFPELNPTARQVDWDIVTEESSLEILPLMKTDIFLSNGVRTLIIDTKYYGNSMQTQFDKATIRNSHIYQVHSYITNYDKEHKGDTDGMLLYAETMNDVQPSGQMKFRDGKTIYFRTLNLNKDFKSIESQLKGFTHQLILEP